ncbi:MAG: gamma carbonic anhydrase family protein [Segniliparus sp.]|uniref:gamma carbonic anhydrase family protein n=1 Tax=Segniliparus sp. TaxID=2804064 RepID=UPI003F373A47
MIVEHRGKRPKVHESAYVAATAVLVGDVVIAEGAQVLHGAVLTAEDGRVTIGVETVVMEQALIRSRERWASTIGNHVMIGPHTHLNGTTVEDGSFIATGASLFPGSRIGARAEVRINAVVHVRTRLPADSMVPIGWVAVGDPAHMFPPDRHDEIWAIQRELDFPGTVYGVSRDTPMDVIMHRQSRFYAAHRHDILLDPPGPPTPPA